MKKNKSNLCMLYLLLAGIVWSAFLSVPFLWDDKGVVVGNPYIRSLTNVVYLFSKQYFVLFTELSYRPIVTLSHMLDFSIGVASPILHHFMGLSLHLVNGVLLFYLLRASVPSRGFLCGIASLIFLINGVHLETLGVVSYRDDMLMACFFISALLFYIHYRKTGRFFSMLFSLFSLFIALFSKETALIFLPVIILIDTFVLDTVTHKASRWKCYVLVCAVYLIYCWIRFFVMTNPEASMASTPFSDTIPLFLRPVCVVLASLSAFFYLSPHGGFDYNTIRMVILSCVGGLAVFAGMAIALRSQWHSRYARMAAILFLLPLIPVCGLYPLENFFAHRYLYLSSMGLAALVPCVAQGVGLSRRWQVCALCALILLFAVRTLTGQRDYASEENFARALLRANPQSYKAYNYLGTISESAGRTDDARAFYEQAIAVEPSFFEAIYNLASVRIMHGDYPAAAPLCSQLIRLNSSRADGYRLSGDLSLQQGDTADAEKNYLAALEKNPLDLDALNNLGTVYESNGSLDAASALYRQILSVAPRYAAAWSNLGNINIKLTDYKFAVECYLRALQLDARNDITWYNLGNAYVYLKKWKNAEKSYLQALQVNPSSTDPLFNLAVVYVAQGNRAAALTALQVYLKDNPTDATAQNYFDILSPPADN